MLEIESIAIGIVGGAMSIIATYIFALIINEQFSGNAVLTVPICIYTLLIAAFIGAISGAYPAALISRKEPSDLYCEV